MYIEQSDLREEYLNRLSSIAQKLTARERLALTWLLDNNPQDILERLQMELDKLPPIKYKDLY